MTLDPRNWWCETCEKEVPPNQVTHDETHDLGAGGCGQHVWPELPASRTSKTQLDELKKYHAEIVNSDGSECEAMALTRWAIEEIERLQKHMISGEIAECGCLLAVGGWPYHSGKTCLSLQPSVETPPKLRFDHPEYLQAQADAELPPRTSVETPELPHCTTCTCTETHAEVVACVERQRAAEKSAEPTDCYCNNSLALDCHRSMGKYICTCKCHAENGDAGQ